MNENPQEPYVVQPFVAAEPFVATDVLDQSEISERRILGMTAIQRFVLMLLVFILTVLLGGLILLVAGKIVPF